jgi:hypothetical protein
MADTTETPNPLAKMTNELKTFEIDAKIAELRHMITVFEKRIAELDDEKPF